MCNNKEINKIQHSFTDNVTCPYCGEEIEDSSDLWLSESPKTVNCHNCDNDFEAVEIIDVTYSTEKIKK